MEPIDQVLAAGMKIFLKLSHRVAAVGEKDYLLGSLAFLATSATPTDGDAASHRKSEQSRSIWPKAFGRFPRGGTPRRSCRQSPRTTLLCEPLEQSHRQSQRSSGRRATAALPSPDPTPRTDELILRPVPARFGSQWREDDCARSLDSRCLRRATRLSGARQPWRRESARPTWSPNTAALDWFVRRANLSWAETCLGRSIDTNIDASVDSAPRPGQTLSSP